MGYHPETMVCSFPKYNGRLSRFRNFIGFDVWHIDPERNVPDQRRDDSCGWFPRNLTPELRRGVDELCSKSHEDVQARIQQAFDRWTIPDARYPSLKEMPMDIAFATHLMTLMWIDRLSFRRWERRLWRRGTPMGRITKLAASLAFSTVDNLNFADDVPRYIRLLAAAYRRDLRPWWKHPRWHVHHWRINFDLTRNLRRMFQRCPACNKALGFGCVPHGYGDKLYHGTCSPSGPNTVGCASNPTPSRA